MNREDPICIRAEDAVRRILSGSRFIHWIAVAPSPDILAALPLAHQRPGNEGRLPVLLCHGCPPGQAYVVLSLADLPYLAAGLFQEMTED